MFRKPLVPNRTVRRIRRLSVITLPAGALLLAYTLFYPALSQAQTYSADDYKASFWTAKRAIERGDDATFGRYSAKLQDTALYPYLLYWHLSRRLSRQLPITIDAFLRRYADTPLAPMLRESWLHHLARHGRWEDYLAFYEESEDVALQCHYHYAQYKTGNETVALEGAKLLWLVGYSQDTACDPLFAAWRKAGGITRDIRWRRIELAMENGETAIATHVVRRLDAADQNRLRLWQRAHDTPSLLRSKSLQDDNDINRMIIFHTLQYRALRAPIGTTALWTEIEPKYTFTPDQRNGLARAIGIGHTYTNDARALQWFAQLPAEDRDLEVCNHALRVALRTENWSSALTWLDIMPDGENNSSKALYWRGRIFENMGFPEASNHFFNFVSKERSYYGFLAADRLNLPYNLNHAPLDVDFSVLERVAKRPDIIRAQELYDLGLVGAARREWTDAIAKMEHEELLAAGKLADAWGWEDRALLTLARADYFDDLNIRFPLGFNKTVFKEAKRRAIDPAWVYAVVRQESAMMPFVKSHVGAVGLMQVMPQTGQEIASQLQLSHFNSRQLLKPETNIHFGSYYLYQTLREFGNNPVLATAAYNAGPHRIRQWTPRQGELDADIWVDTIPFDETREYVRRVMAYSVFYDQRLKRPFKRLSERMRPVSKKTFVTRCDHCQDAKAILAQADTSSIIE